MCEIFRVSGVSPIRFQFLILFKMAVQLCTALNYVEKMKVKAKIRPQAASAPVGGHTARAPLSGTQGDKVLDMEGRAHALLSRFPRPHQAAGRGSSEFWKWEGRTRHDGRRPSAKSGSVREVCNDPH